MSTSRFICVAAGVLAAVATTGCAGGEQADATGAAPTSTRSERGEIPTAAPPTTATPTVADTRPEPVVVTTAQAVGVDESATTTAPTGVDRATVDTCTLLTSDEVAAALGSEVGSVTPSTGAGGNHRGCSWVSATDELVELSVAITNGLDAYNPDGWSRDWVPVDGLGDESYLSHDFGFRIGFTRTDVSVMLNALGGVGDDAIWTDVAKLVDARLQNNVELP